MRGVRRHRRRRQPGHHSDCHHRSLLHRVRGGAGWERAGHVYHRQVRQTSPPRNSVRVLFPLLCAELGRLHFANKLYNVTETRKES